MKTMTRTAPLRLLAGASLALFSASCSRTPPGTFKEPAEAVKTMDAYVGKGDVKAVEAMFGAGAMEMFQSGDPIADAEDAAKVKAMIAEKVAFEDVDETTKVALFGNDAWPFPIPLVLENGSWRFDSAKGREELHNRRVGRNELLTIASLHAFVDAQREYASQGRDGLPPQFARRVLSSEGKHDGLYWPTAEGEEQSPLGDLIAAAAARGLDASGEAGPQPYNGYYFRILDAEVVPGVEAPRSYVDDAGNMTRGFGCIAWPAKYGNSGVMTFMVSKSGVVFNKDLGEGTEAAAAAITAYGADDTWTPTYDPDAVPETASAEPAATP